MKSILPLIFSCISFIGLNFADTAKTLNLIEQSLDKSNREHRKLICKARLMKRLGYQFKTHSSAYSNLIFNKGGSLTDSQVCKQNTVNGFLELNFVTEGGQISTSALARFAQEANNYIKSTPSLCGFKLKYAKALEGSAQTLSDLAKSGHYSFPQGTGGPFARLPGKWKQSHQGLFYTPKNGVSASEGLYDLYQNPFQTECAVGLQLSELYSLWFLFRNDIDGTQVGDRNFDKAFSSEQMAIGTWEGISRSTNPFRSMVLRNIGEVSDKTGSRFASLGKHGLTGVTGYIGKKKWELALNSPADRGENFIVIRMSDRAAQEIARNGVRTLDHHAQTAWRKYGKKFKFGFVRPRPEAAKAYLHQFPVFKETIVYVHPLGLMSLGDHISRLIDVNPATAYNFQFYPNRINYGIFDQYTQFHFNNCLNNL